MNDTKTFFQCIEEYPNGCGKEIECRHKAVGELSETAFWDAVRCTKPHAPLNLPHTKAWYFKEQTDYNGAKMSLRDAFIQEAKHRNILNNNLLKTFADIFTEVQRVFISLRDSGKKGAGQMTVYDIALYIATRKNIEPIDVYIYRGVIKGAVAMGLVPDAKKNCILPLQEVLNKQQDLKALRTAKHIENFLCIYHHQLEGIAYGRRR